MKINKQFYIIAVLVFIVFIGFLLTAPDSIFERQIKKHKLDYLYHKLERDKKFIAITQNNSTGYFIYKGKAMGFHYDLLKEYCQEKGYQLEIKVEDDLEKAIQMINQGKAHVLAIDLTLTKDRKNRLSLSEAHSYNHQVLLQRKKNKKDTTRFVRGVFDLEGKKVYIQKGTVFKQQLESLKEQTGVEFEIIEDSERSMEELIALVAEKRIDYTACDQRAAKVLEVFHSNVDHSFAISVNQKLCWAMPPQEDSIKISINNWLVDFKTTKKFSQLEAKYFNSKKTEHLNNQNYLPSQGGQLTPYDKEIKKYASQIGWDWRLLASLIYQESRFNPETVSWGGALGLMQVMPETATKMGITDIFSIEGNLQAGTRFLKWVDKQFIESVPDSIERISFVLAAYNCGLGHVIDAQKLAKKYGKNPAKWKNHTATYLLLKSNAKYYHDPVVKSGFCRGNITYKFVNEILYRYNHYRNLIKE